MSFDPWRETTFVPAEHPPIDLDALPPLIYRTAQAKAAAMRADPDRYFAIVQAQRAAEVGGRAIPTDDEALAGEDGDV